MQAYNILLLGSGGRECALAWKLRQSKYCKELFIAPGNAGTAQYGMNLHLSPTDFESIKDACLEYHIDILFPGAEDPLVKGIYDYFLNDAQLKHIIVTGPSKEGAQLEGSKAFSKKFMERHNIPTAAYREFTASNFDDGVNYLQHHSLPIVLKADGLAAGKGVVICDTAAEAIGHFTSMIQHRAFGEASSKVVVEQFLTGMELSVFVMTDGENYVLLPEAKDYKRIGEGDMGPNTGGMGAISPVPFADNLFINKVRSAIIDPTIKGLKDEQIVYKGFIFFGLINVNGEPYVIEYNCRMGDPETEVVMPRMENDLVELMVRTHENTLHEVTMQHSAKTACTVMLVSKGYPSDYEKNKEMSILSETEGSLLFHAGTKLEEGKMLTNGGRVLAITSYGDTLEEALQKSYKNAALVNFEGKTYRRDIGYEFQPAVK
ncbi:MAG TPA: phosphoribosylamine--glycine ligase [Flavipsychrobacter sp.]|nr:phosphoribosylamine--glycine ligase [Flavipsychrobacter sp.]